jgi:hypothetical protein
MITISDETIQAWYVEFLREGWSSNKFNERISEMRNLKTYGERIDISDWFEKEGNYTPAQVAEMLQKRINEIITRANRLLVDKEFLVELVGVNINLDEVKYRISKTVTTYYDNDCKEKADEVFEEILPQVLKKLNLSKKDDFARVGIGTRMKKRLQF